MPSVDKSAIVEILTKPEKYRNVQYELGEKEFLSAVRHLPPVRRRIRFASLLSVIVLVVAVWMYTVGAFAFGVIFASLAVVYPFLILSTFRTIYRKAYRTMRATIGTQIELTYGHGFMAQTTVSVFSYLTSLYQVCHTKKFRLLGTSTQLFIIVPVRAFENPMALAEFDNITSELAQGRVVGK